MSRIDLVCNHCGVSFQVAANEDYATCPICRTHLKIEEDEHTFWTIIVEQRAYTTKSLPPEEVTIPLLRQNLLDLQKAWMVEQDNYKIWNKGRLILPRRNKSMAYCLVALGLVIFFFLTWRFISLFIGSAIAYRYIPEFRKALEYERAKQLFEEQKEAIREAIFLLN